MKRGFVRSVLLAVVLACGWQAIVAAPVLAERGRSAPRPDPTKLWKAYPLKPREQPLPPTKPAASAARTRITAPGSSDGRQSSPLLLVSVVLALAILAGGVLLVSDQLASEIPAIGQVMRKRYAEHLDGLGGHELREKKSSMEERL